MAINDELNKRVYVKEMKDAFNLVQITGNDDSLKRWAIAPDINRPGLELAGYDEPTELKRVVLIGNKEYSFIQTLDEQTQRDRFGFLTDSYTPCIVVTAGLKTPEVLKEIANAKNFPVFEYPEKTYIFTAELTAFLSEKLAQTETIHGEMLNIYGVGVLVCGESGMGKSELALDLIKRGHFLVADDVVEYAKIHNQIFCRAPQELKKMLEVRGLGILDITYMFGAQCYLESSNLDFIIKLVTIDEYNNNNNNRLEPTEKTANFFGIKKIVLEIPVSQGKTMAPIIEASVINYILKRRGIDSNENFKQNIRDLITKRNRGEE